MRALVAKEIRLLLPAAVAALLLAVAPVWVLSRSQGPNGNPALYPLCLGALLLALSSFGREFASSTFTQMLSQPLDRRQVWRVKTGTLAAALVFVLAVWGVCCAVWMRDWWGKPVWQDVLPLGAFFSLAIFAGGLWTTLLFRNVAAAFWLTVLIPAGITMWFDPTSRHGWIFYGIILVYSVAGIIFASRQFLNAQEVGWTGGTVSLALQGKRSVSESVARRYRPLRTTLAKEFRLQRVGLVGMAAFFLVHLGTALLRTNVQAVAAVGAREAVDFVGGLWLVVPFFIAGASVAEERRLGTFASRLCEPMTVRRQFAIKLLVSLGGAGLLSALLFWVAESVGSAAGAPSGLTAIHFFSELKQPFNSDALWNLSLLFLGLSLAAFFASTITIGMISAMVAAVITISALVATSTVLNQAIPPSFIGRLLFPLIFWPSVVLVVIWRARRNFPQTNPGWRLWRSNLNAFVGTLIFSLAATTLVYDRTWEWFTPLEPQHETARPPLKVGAAVEWSGRDFATYIWSDSTLLLPDHRVWVNPFNYHPGPVRLVCNLRFAGDDYITISAPGHWGSGGSGFIQGSNWVSVIEARQNLVAVRDDGALWVSEAAMKNPAEFQKWLHTPLVRYGDSSDWKKVVMGQLDLPLLLKGDGTLWQWSEPSIKLGERHSIPTLRTMNISRLGADSDWSDVRDEVFIKNDGSVWQTWASSTNAEAADRELGPGLYMRPIPILDNVHFRSAINVGGWLVIRDDGSLWFSRYHFVRNDSGVQATYDPLIRVGTDSDWDALSPIWWVPGGIAALKSNGTLWKLTLSLDNDSRLPIAVLGKPKRLGSHDDWVGIVRADRGLVALAADGSLWKWNVVNYYDYPLLAPSRKPELIGNIFAGTKQGDL